eukprot:30488_1
MSDRSGVLLTFIVLAGFYWISPTQFTSVLSPARMWLTASWHGLHTYYSDFGLFVVITSLVPTVIYWVLGSDQSEHAEPVPKLGGANELVHPGPIVPTPSCGNNPAESFPNTKGKFSFDNSESGAELKLSCGPGLVLTDSVGSLIIGAESVVVGSCGESKDDPSKLVWKMNDDAATCVYSIYGFALVPKTRGYIKDQK